MKRELLICFCALTLVASTTVRMYACCEEPVSDFLITPSSPQCVGTTITFDAGDMAYDPDGTTLTYEWDFGDGETGTGELVTHSYDEGDEYTVTLTVTDNDNSECCNSSDPNCVDKDDESSQTIKIVEVDSIVKSGTTDPGPIDVCLNDTVDLEAKPDPAGASFPTNEPNWSIVSQPEGATASLSPSSGSATTTLSGLSTLGEYVIKSQCCDSDTGDSITIDVSQENPGVKSLRIYWKTLFDDGSFMYDFDDTNYDPDLTCWCSHYTSESNKFGHAHTPAPGFPIEHDGDTYTASMSDKWWATYKYKTSNGYSRISSSSCYGNCFTYATGRSYWISGWSTLLDDDYVQTSGTDAEFYTNSNPGNHAVKIIDFYESGCVKKIKEKTQTSGIYEKTLSDGSKCPGEGGEYYWKAN